MKRKIFLPNDWHFSQVRSYIGSLGLDFVRGVLDYSGPGWVWWQRGSEQHER